MFLFYFIFLYIVYNTVPDRWERGRRRSLVSYIYIYIYGLYVHIDEKSGSSQKGFRQLVRSRRTDRIPTPNHRARIRRDELSDALCNTCMTGQTVGLNKTSQGGECRNNKAVNNQTENYNLLKVFSLQARINPHFIRNMFEI